MKKILFLAGLLGVFVSQSEAAVDKFKSERDAVWRSSRTCAAENFVMLATGPIHLYAVQIESPTTNTASWVSFFNSTHGNTILYSFSTAAFLDTSVFGAQDFERQPVIFNVPLSSGGAINKSGPACINCFWDFIDPFGIENKIVPFVP